MTRADRAKWDGRYEGGDRPHDGPPSEFLTRWLPYLPRGRALDVAAGLGRNAMRLAEHGYHVDAVDISPVGLAVARARAQARGLRVRWIEADLDSWEPPSAHYAVVIMAFYLNRTLLPRLLAAVKPGGVMVVETHLRSEDEECRSRYRLRPGELRRTFADWEILELEEGRFGGDAHFLGRIIAQRPGGRRLHAPAAGLHRRSGAAARAGEARAFP